MQIFKQIKKVRNRKITLDIPENFDSKEVEVIIFPVDKTNQKELSELLLKGPTLSKEEMREYEEVSKWLREWQIAQF